MREIKFRAWHKEQRKMYSAEEMGQDQLTLMPDGRGFANINSSDVRLSEIDNGCKMIPLQFTGLKDKSGKECYFDDLVKWGRSIYRVIWDSDEGVAWLGKLSGEEVFSKLRIHLVKQGEVIGNIWEQEGKNV